jgi:hypothetical protein
MPIVLDPAEKDARETGENTSCAIRPPKPSYCVGPVRVPPLMPKGMQGEVRRRSGSIGQGRWRSDLDDGDANEGGVVLVHGT